MRDGVVGFRALVLDRGPMADVRCWDAYPSVAVGCCIQLAQQVRQKRKCS